MTTADVPVSPELRAQVERVARMVRADVVESDGVLTVVGSAGVFARVRGEVLELRSGAHPGTIAIEPVPDAPGWWRVDPFPTGVTFRRGPDLLRDAFERAARAVD